MIETRNEILALHRIRSLNDIEEDSEIFSEYDLLKPNYPYNLGSMKVNSLLVKKLKRLKEGVHILDGILGIGSYYYTTVGDKNGKIYYKSVKFISENLDISDYKTPLILTMKYVNMGLYKLKL